MTVPARSGLGQNMIGRGTGLERTWFSSLYECLMRHPIWSLAVLLFAIWLPSLFGGFLHDDYEVIAKWQNASLYFGRFGHVGLLQLTGHLPFLYRLVMVIIHIANSLLVYGIVRELRPAQVAFVAALIFGTSYLAAEAVFYGPHLEAAFTILASILLLLRLRRQVPPRLHWFALVGACATLGTFFSEEAIAIPVMVGLYGLLGKPRRYWLVSFAAVLLCLDLSSFAGQMAIRSHAGGIPPPSHLLSSTVTWLVAPVKIGTAVAFFAIAPWYQTMRWAGLMTIPALALSALLVGIGAWSTPIWKRRADVEWRTVVWLALCALACLAPVSFPGTTEDIPTMAGRYLYPAWGIAVVMLVLVIRLGCGSVGWAVALRTRLWLAAYLVCSLLLVGAAQSRFLQRCHLDRDVVRIANEALAAGTAHDIVLVGDFPLEPAALPSPTPGPLAVSGYKPRFYHDMLLLRGWQVNVTASPVVPPARPGQLVIDLNQLTTDGTSALKPSGGAGRR